MTNWEQHVIQMGGLCRQEYQLRISTSP